ncbi:thiamine phosphate synthase [Desulfovibrio sp. OttesenSCG-928-F20]|nr:thiamine phosphate synthase [Desulfovibrio sp. OttesenSCG-928-F20]
MKKVLDLSLYLVLDPDLCGGIKGMVHTVSQAVDNGVTVVQLRADQFKKGRFLEAALAIKEILADRPVPLIINNEIDVALAADADGVHIGQKDLPPEFARRLLGPDKYLGLSTSNEEEVRAAPRKIVDYLGIGPVFPTTSKKDAPPVLGLEKLARLAALKEHPTVAIGGINADSARQVMACGVQGIAVVSAICGQAKPGQSSARLAQELALAGQNR